jgi:cytochrome c oxidase subunit 3
MTILLAIIFTAFQFFEYSQSGINISDSVFSSAFFCSTGLHGMHVIIGTLMLFVSFLKLLTYQTTNTHHVGTESGIYY